MTAKKVTYGFMATIDDFFVNPNAVYSEISSGRFEDIESDWDNQRYPDINKNISVEIQDYVTQTLSKVLAAKVVVQTIFARVTCRNTPDPPHHIHSDRAMSTHACHVYLSKHWPENSGTSFWRHKDHGSTDSSVIDSSVITQDTKNREQWIKTFTCQGQYNRLFVHDANLFHCAEPVGGWGDDATNGRLVLTCFFNLEPL